MVLDSVQSEPPPPCPATVGEAYENADSSELNLNLHATYKTAFLDGETDNCLILKTILGSEQPRPHSSAPPLGVWNR